MKSYSIELTAQQINIIIGTFLKQTVTPGELWLPVLETMRMQVEAADATPPEGSPELDGKS